MPDDTLHAIETMVNDKGLQGRIHAAVAKKKSEGFEIGTHGSVTQWAFDNRYEMASAPGWGAAYQYALDTGGTDPGIDPAVITDAMILSQVQMLLEEQAANPPGQRQFTRMVR